MEDKLLKQVEKEYSNFSDEDWGKYEEETRDFLESLGKNGRKAIFLQDGIINETEYKEVNT